MHQSHHIVGSEARKFAADASAFAPAHGSLRAFTARRDLGAQLAVAFGAGVCAVVAYLWTVA